MNLIKLYNKIDTIFMNTGNNKNLILIDYYLIGAYIIHGKYKLHESNK